MSYIKLKSKSEFGVLSVIPPYSPLIYLCTVFHIANETETGQCLSVSSKEIMENKRGAKNESNNLF